MYGQRCTIIVDILHCIFMVTARFRFNREYSVLAHNDMVNVAMVGRDIMNYFKVIRLAGTP